MSRLDDALRASEVLSVMGAHADKDGDTIFGRKIEDCRIVGRTFWVAKSDPAKTVEKFRELPTRPPARTDLVAYDYVLLVPVYVDNVNPPRIARDNTLGIDVDGEYEAMLEQICRAYKARWRV